jgi:limonene-1,2-epoxide hydrolase
MSNADVVARFIAAWESLDVDTIMSFFATNACYRNVPLPAHSGHSEIRAFFMQFLANVASISVDVRHSAENSQGTVFNERVDRLTFDDGRTMTLEVSGVFEVVDGKVSGWRDYFDMKSFAAQMA